MAAKSEGSYRAVIPIEIVAELSEPLDRRWGDVKEIAQISSSPQFFPRVFGPGISALRALFPSPSLGRADYFLPGPDVDWLGLDQRHVINRAITYRRGQRRFRDGLLRAYDGRCAVPGSSVAAVLGAAHISPYRGDHTNRVDNGLLLRADIHTLFDLDLLTVTPTLTVKVSGALAGTEYSAFDGQPLTAPLRQQLRPNPEGPRFTTHGVVGWPTRGRRTSSAVTSSWLRTSRYSFTFVEHKTPRSATIGR